MSLCALGISLLLFDLLSFTALWSMSQCFSSLILGSIRISQRNYPLKWLDFLINAVIWIDVCWYVFSCTGWIGAVIRKNKRIVHGIRDNCSYSTGIQEQELFLDHIRVRICIFKTKAKPAICLTIGEFRLLRNPDIALYYPQILRKTLFYIQRYIMIQVFKVKL